MLIEAARARGIARLGGEVLADNTKVRSVLARLGFAFRRDPDGGDVFSSRRRCAGRPAAR